MIRIGSDTDIGMIRNSSDRFGMNSYPKLSPGFKKANLQESVGYEVSCELLYNRVGRKYRNFHFVSRTNGKRFFFASKLCMKKLSKMS